MTSHAALIAHLEVVGPRLTERVLAEMYKNPFWHERYGERADRHGKQDGQFHLQYLAQALSGGGPEVMANYARWLQQLLTTRGMCTRHIDDNFRLLAIAIDEDGHPDRAMAAPVLAGAREALRYAEGTARQIQDAASAIAERATTALYSAHPDWLERWGAAGQQRCADDLLYHLSYCADAVALGEPSVFRNYVAWIGDFLERRSIPRAHLETSLVVLRGELAVIVPAQQLAELFD